MATPPTNNDVRDSDGDTDHQTDRNDSEMITSDPGLTDDADDDQDYLETTNGNDDEDTRNDRNNNEYESELTDHDQDELPITDGDDDFPKAHFGVSEQNKAMLIVVMEEGLGYTFMLQHDRASYQLYTCVGCRSERRRMKKAKLSSLPKVSSLKFCKTSNSVKASDIKGISHCCEATAQSSDWITSEQVIRLVGFEVRKTRAPPSEAILNIDGRVTEAIPDIMDRGTFQRKKKSLQRRLRRNRARGGPITVDPNAIPTDVQKSLLPGGGKVVKHFAPDGPPSICMADDHNLKILAGCKDIIMDGTFSRAPEGSRQLYTLHALYMDGVEKQSAYVSAVLVLSSATEATYTTELRRLRNLMEVNGPVNVERFHLDCEEAMVNAVRTVFPESTVVLCYFHFVKNLHDKLNSLRAHDLKRHPAFQKFLKEIKGSVFLPDNVFREKFAELLLSAPDVGRTLKLLLDQFKDYLSGFWYRLGDFLSQFDNSGPRTTNLAEGYHRGIQTLFPETHPHYGKLIFKMKEVLRSAALSFQNSADGTCLQRRSQTVIDSDIRINAAKVEFAARHANNLVDMIELRHYCRHQSLNASPSYYKESDPDAVYPNHRALQSEAQASTVSSQPRVQQRRRRAIPVIAQRGRRGRPTRTTQPTATTPSALGAMNGNFGADGFASFPYELTPFGQFAMNFQNMSTWHGMQCSPGQSVNFMEHSAMGHPNFLNTGVISSARDSGMTNSMGSGIENMMANGLGSSMGSGMTNSMGSGIENMMANGLGSSMRRGMTNSMGSGIENMQANGLGSSMRRGMTNSMGSGIENMQANGLGSSMRRGMTNSMGSGLENMIANGLGSSMGSGMTNSMGSGLENMMANGLGSSMRRGMTNSMGSGIENMQANGLGSSMRRGMTNSMGSGIENMQANGLGSSMGSGMTNSMGSGLENMMANGLGSSMRRGMNNLMGTGLENMMANGLGSSMGSGMNNLMGSGLENMMANGLGSSMGSGMNNLMGTGLENMMANGLGSSMGSGMNNLMGSGLENFVNQRDSGYGLSISTRQPPPFQYPSSSTDPRFNREI